MKTRLPNMTVPRLIAVIVVLLTLYAAFSPSQIRQTAQLTENREDKRRPDGDRSNPADENTRDSNTVITESIRLLEQHASLRAKIRQQIDIYDQQLVGAGDYLQFKPQANRAGQGGEIRPRMRMEMKLQVAGAVTSLLQVSDGRFLWQRSQDSRGVRVSRVDVRRLAESSIAEPEMISNLRIGAGGLPGLLAKIQHHFDLQAARRDRLAGIPIWLVRGRWKKSSLAMLLPSQAEEIRTGQDIRFPEHLPDTVEIRLRADNELPLFPHTIAYLRSASSDSDTDRTMVSLELHQVNNRVQLDPRLFVFQPRADQFVEDKTGQ